MEPAEIRWFDLENRCGQWTPDEQREVLDLAAARMTPDKELAEARAEIEDLGIEVAMLEHSVDDKDDEIEELEAEVARLKGELEAATEKAR